MKFIFDTHGGDSELNDRSGQSVTVLRALTEQEADIADVGKMFCIRFEDGFETDAFADELALDEITPDAGKTAKFIFSAKDKEFILGPVDEQLVARDGKSAIVLEVLSKDDSLSVGLLLRICFADGYEADVYADELTLDEFTPDAETV